MKPRAAARPPRPAPRPPEAAAANPRRARLARLWPGWPTTWIGLIAMAVGAFLLGVAITVPLAVYAPRLPSQTVALARSVVGHGDARGDAQTGARAAVTAPAPGEHARKLALDSFTAGDEAAGVEHFRAAMRAQPRAADDDVLILYTIGALSDAGAGDAARRLLRELGAQARPLLTAAARTHPDRQVRARTRAMIAGPAQGRRAGVSAR